MLAQRVLMIATMTGAADAALPTAKPAQSDILAQVKDAGYTCSADEFEDVTCDWGQYEKPHHRILLRAKGGQALALAFWTIPADDQAFNDVPQAMTSLAQLNFEGSMPDRVGRWLGRCVGSPGVRTRPKPLDLRTATYVCTGEPNAPGFSIYWLSASLATEE